LHTSEKTHQRILPQSAALEPASADNREGKDETGRGRRGNPATGVQHGRGETGETWRHPASPEQSGGAGDRGLAASRSTAGRVFVLDKHGHPLMPTTPARARRLLHAGRARVHRLAPFVIRLMDRTVEQSQVDGVEFGIAPGSKHTGVAVFRVDEQDARHGLVAIEVQHRGWLIHKRMGQRSNYRSRRRTANLRYRQPRWRNRHPDACASCGKNAVHKRRYCRPCASTRSFIDNGYRRHRLPPSLQHRVDSTMSMVTKVRRWVPVTAIHLQLAKFDMQKLESPEISGVEYQHGTLFGYEVREYLLEKWGRSCAYCAALGVGTKSVPLNIDHIHPKARGGADRVSNLTMACVSCNQTKGSRPVQEFLAHDPEHLASVLAQAKAPLRDAAAVNSTRWALWRALVATGLPVKTGSGGRTKWNRSRFGLAKSHTLDALCVAKVGSVASWPGAVTTAKATGRGQYQRTKWTVTRPCLHCGKPFPRKQEELLARKSKAARARSQCCFTCRAARTFSDEGHRAKHSPFRIFMRAKTSHGFASGDLVRAVVPSGKHAGMHVGRVSVRARGSFGIGAAGDISWKHCRILQRGDGWEISKRKEEPGLERSTTAAPIPPPPEGGSTPAQK